jgi:prevent-host-death family protein
MRTIPAGEFKAKCLAIMDEVQAGGEPVIVTKRGKPVVRIAPLEIKQERSILGFMQGMGTITGDIVSPIYSDEELEQFDTYSKSLLGM